MTDIQCQAVAALLIIIAALLAIARDMLEVREVRREEYQFVQAVLKQNKKDQFSNNDLEARS